MAPLLVTEPVKLRTPPQLTNTDPPASTETFPLTVPQPLSTAPLRTRRLSANECIPPFNWYVAGSVPSPTTNCAPLVTNVDALPSNPALNTTTLLVFVAKSWFALTEPPSKFRVFVPVICSVETLVKTPPEPTVRTLPVASPVSALPMIREVFSMFHTAPP